MPTATETIQEIAERDYEFGFVTDIEQDSIPAGLDEDTIRLLSAKKEEPEYMLEWRLKAYRQWLKMEEPDWQNVQYSPIDYQSLVYYSAPKSMADGPKSLDEVDPELLKTYEKLGIPLKEQAVLAGVEGAPRYAVDAVFDAMRMSMQRGERIELRGFGVFQVKPRKRGIGRNPRTGKEVRIPPGRTIRFKPGKDLQNIGN